MPGLSATGIYLLAEKKESPGGYYHVADTIVSIQGFRPSLIIQTLLRPTTASIYSKYGQVLGEDPPSGITHQRPTVVFAWQLLMGHQFP